MNPKMNEQDALLQVHADLQCALQDVSNFSMAPTEAGQSLEIICRLIVTPSGDHGNRFLYQPSCESIFIDKRTY